MPDEPKRTLIVLPDAESLARHVAGWLYDIATAKSGGLGAGPVAVALSGGSTPKALYQMLAASPHLEIFPWSRVHWFWGDERFVPHGDALSNYRMVDEAMLAPAPVPPENIHAVPTEGVTPEAAALAYEASLKTFYGADRLDSARPLFDVNLLGLGEDGHTASLFPGTAVLDEREHWAAAVIGAKAEPRITLTYPTLESSRLTAFLVAGVGKQAMLARLMAGDPTLPAARVNPVGELLVFADAAAAHGLAGG